MDQPVPRVELAFRPKESFAAPGSNIRKPEDQVDMTAENTELHATQHKAQAPIGGRKHTRPAAGPLKSSSKQEAPEQKEPVVHEWSDVPGPLHEAVIACLKRVCHDLNTLARSGYKVREMTKEDVKGYAKCRNCGGAYKSTSDGIKYTKNCCRAQESSRYEVKDSLFLPPNETQTPEETIQVSMLWKETRMRLTAGACLRTCSRFYPGELAELSINTESYARASSTSARGRARL